MHCMAAPKANNSTPGLMHVLQAHWTIILNRHTFMVILVININTAFTLIAMVAVFNTAHSAAYALWTVENFFRFPYIVVPYFADAAVVAGKRDLTFRTILSSCLNLETV